MRSGGGGFLLRPCRRRFCYTRPLSANQNHGKWLMVRCRTCCVRRRTFLTHAGIPGTFIPQAFKPYFFGASMLYVFARHVPSCFVILPATYQTPFETRMKMLFTLLTYHVHSGSADDRYVHHNSYRVRLLSLFDCPAPIYNFVGGFWAFILSHPGLKYDHACMFV